MTLFEKIIRFRVEKKVRKNICLESKLPELWERYAELVNDANENINSEVSKDAGKRVGEVGPARLGGTEAAE